MRYFLIIIGLIFILITGIALCTFTVTQKEYVILTQFGKHTHTIKNPGLYFKRPGFLETVNRIDSRTHVFTTQPIQLLLGDKNPIILTCYICWRVADPMMFFQSLVDMDIAKQKLGDMINSQLGGTLGDYFLENIINIDSNAVKLEKIEERVMNGANTNTRQKYGIEIVKIGIRKIAYPSIVADAVYNRMRSEREKEAMKYRAEGMEAASRIRANTDRQVKEIQAQCYKESEILKGEGEQKAVKIYAEAYSKDTNFFEFQQSMELYKDILNQKSTLILSTESELLKFLNNPYGKEK